jgi:hypothetical protein
MPTEEQQQRLAQLTIGPRSRRRVQGGTDGLNELLRGVRELGFD